MSYYYSNETQSVARFRYDGQQANRLYETAVREGVAYAPPLVTDMFMAEGIFTSDAYNTAFSEIINSYIINKYEQFNMNSNSGALISTILAQNVYTDIFFFNDQCSRWLCFGHNPEDTAYLRDPSTDTNYIPPKDNNPVANIYIGGGKTTLWATSAEHVAPNICL